MWQPRIWQYSKQWYERLHHNTTAAELTLSTLHGLQDQDAGHINSLAPGSNDTLFANIFFSNVFSYILI